MPRVRIGYTAPGHSRLSDPVERRAVPRGHQHTASTRRAKRRLRAAVGRDPVAGVQSHTDDRPAIPIETAVPTGGRLGRAEADRRRGKCAKPIGEREIPVKVGREISRRTFPVRSSE